MTPAGGWRNRFARRLWNGVASYEMKPPALEILGGRCPLPVVALSAEGALRAWVALMASVGGRR